MPSSVPRRLLSSRFVKNSGMLFSGSAVSQGIAFVAYLLLSRLFSCEDFALYNIFYSYIEVFIILSTCKYEVAIVKADTDAEAGAIARFSMRLNAVVSVVILVAAGILALSHSRAVPLPPLLVMLIPFMVFFCGTTRVYSFLFNRYGHFRQMAVSEVVTSLSATILKISFGFLAALGQFFHVVGLPLGTVLGKVVGNLYCRVRAAKLLPQQKPGASVCLRQLLRKYRHFPLYAMPREFVSSFSANLPFMWLGFYFDNVSLGLFSMAVVFTMRPVQMVANVFERVLYPATKEKIDRRQPIGVSIRRFLLVLCAVMVPLLGVSFFFAEPIFTFLLGDKWLGCGYYVRCIIPWIAFLVLANSMAFVPNVFTTQRADFIFQVVQLCLRAVALWIGICWADFRLAVLLFCAVSTVVQSCQLGWYLYQISRYDKQLVI